jgi:hypothetical protein
MDPIRLMDVPKGGAIFLYIALMNSALFVNSRSRISTYAVRNFV